MPPEGFLQEYIEEVKEHIQELEKSLLILEREGSNKEEIASIFRAAHSIKGISSYMGYHQLAALTHEIENLISSIQAGSRPVTNEGVNTILRCIDFLSGALRHLQETGEEPPLPPSLVQELREALSDELPEALEGIEKEASFDARWDAEFLADAGQETAASPPDEERDARSPDHGHAPTAAGEERAEDAEGQECDDEEEDQELLAIYIDTFKEAYRELEALALQPDGSTSVESTGKQASELIRKLLGSSHYMGYDRIADSLNELEIAVMDALYGNAGGEKAFRDALAVFARRFQSMLPALDLHSGRDQAIESIDASLEDEAIEEEDDEELFGIYLDSVRQNLIEVIKLTPPSPAAMLPDSDIEQARTLLRTMIASSQYMDYDPVVKILSDWEKLLVELHENHLLDGERYAQSVETGSRKMESLLPELSLTVSRDAPAPEEFCILTSLEEEINASLDALKEATEVQAPPAGGLSREDDALDACDASQRQEWKCDDLTGGGAMDGAVHATGGDNAPSSSHSAEATGQTEQKSIARRPPIAAFAEDAPTETPTVRIDTHKVDQLLNQVGELVVARSEFIQTATLFKEMLRELTIQGKLSKQELRGLRTLSFRLNESTLSLGRIAGDLQNSVMRVRMLPISNLFGRFPRVARDQAIKLGRKVRLVLEGGETEIDKRILEQMHDPVVQFLRNAIAHGIESPEERRKRGKPEEGVIRLAAYHEGDYVILEVEDDGRGVDIKKLRSLLTRNATIAQHELDRLSDKDLMYAIFLPGISTHDGVDESAGRGVGLDVVKENVERMNGSIEVESEWEVGTRFIIRIPLTVAIIRALLVKAGDQTLTVPLGSVSEILRYSGDDVYFIENREVITLRGRTIPLFPLGELLHMPIRENSRGKKSIVIVSTSFHEVGLVVDELVGEREVVIKPVEDEFCAFEGLSGATILGDGSVSLVLDVSSLVKMLKDAMQEGPRNSDATPRLH